MSSTKNATLFVITLLCAQSTGLVAWAQNDTSPIIPATEIQELMEESAVEPVAESQPSGIDLLTLIARGGAFMIPIGLMSLMVVALAFERMVMMRQRILLPPQLELELRELNAPTDQFDPSEAFQACGRHPSALANVIRAMLMRTGQSLGEVERTANETIEREADRYAAPLRWLTLAAAATPLMGLLGTVWGMIVAFHESTTLTPDRTRSEQLSEGIYTALVTTLAGLVVAIPAAYLALYLENRLAKLFHQVEEFAFEMAPGLDRFSGKRRLDADGRMHPMNDSVTDKEVVQPPPPPTQPTRAKQRDDMRAG
ncbi:MAG: MotA/TolQ/ExbB proton channel family protein [Rubripirellula sp.]